ncbi:MAG: hypothetical protein GC193_14945 [Cryomorphaceae bacterium]|nr:hypothetical protein [Cryomorphaceae bacterium]
MKVKCNVLLPTDWDDLLDEQGKLSWVIHTMKEWDSDADLPLDWSHGIFGILIGEDGIVDIVVKVPKIDEDVIKIVLSELTNEDLDDIDVEHFDPFKE